MERFIADLSVLTEFANNYLKSSMERFIVSSAAKGLDDVNYLKSSMERFIERENAPISTSSLI